MIKNIISISIVSHGQTALVKNLLDDLQRVNIASAIEVLLTLNTLDEQFDEVFDYSFPIRRIRNSRPLGFGANHNQAFGFASGGYFCVLNPDVRLEVDPFPELIQCLANMMVGISAPLVLDGDGKVDDSARRFPSPIMILSKILGFRLKSPYSVGQTNIYPDWVAGMFMLFRSETFEQINGFDERYFLYYEDVDICARLTNAGKSIALCPASKVTHLAQRTSHRNVKYLRWHVTSMLRFFLSSAYWRLVWR
jgi:GT2 family glycosyltransferase